MDLMQESNMRLSLDECLELAPVLEVNQTFNPFKEELFKDPLLVKKGYMDPPAKPGFGVELKPNAAEKFPYLPGSWSKPNPNLPAIS
jgi:galactonate dehydratase